MRNRRFGRPSSCGRNPLESENSVKTGLAKPSEISFTKPTQQGRYRISPMAGEPPAGGSGALNEQATQSRGADRPFRRGRLI